MTEPQITETVIDWLKAANADRQDTAKIGPESNVLAMNALDSIEILELVHFLEERFGASVPLENLVAENFETPSSIAAMVMRAQP